MMRAFLCALGVLALVGCAATINDQSRVQYVQEGFNATELEAGGLALLPVVAGQGQEGYRRPLGDEIDSAISIYGTNIPYTGWQEAMNALNERGLVEDYQSMISNYRETAIIDKGMLAGIGEALGVHYILFVSLEDFSKDASTRYSLFSGWTTTKTATVQAFAQIWDCRACDVVWEGSGTAQSTGGELTYEKPYEEYSRIAAQGLVKNLLGIGGKS
jgi:hypothetical protein